MTCAIPEKIVAAMILAARLRQRRAIVLGPQSFLCVVTNLAPPIYLTVRAIVGKHCQPFGAPNFVWNRMQVMLLSNSLNRSGGINELQRHHL
jgi:hypothetical protein